MHALSLNQIQYSWGTNNAPTLNIPSWHVQAGEKVFLSGASGSGKTTLLQLLAGIFVAKQGRLEILGQNLNQLSTNQRDAFRATHLGFVFQLFNLLPFLNVTENVLLATRFSRTRLQRAKQAHGDVGNAAQGLLQALDIAAFADRAVHTLSVGQQQRVALARALIGEPEIIICDEPTSAIDAPQRDSFMRLLLEQVARTKATLVFVSHDPSLAHYFDRHVQLSDINIATGAAP
jgi:putative ABC transport system ATP-binding protein